MINLLKCIKREINVSWCTFSLNLEHIHLRPSHEVPKMTYCVFHVAETGIAEKLHILQISEMKNSMFAAEPTHSPTQEY